MELTGADRRALRALGNTLKPAVFVGKDGITAGVLTAIEEAHHASELIKVRILDTCPVDRKEVGADLDERTESSVVQILGRTLLLFRADPDEPRISIPSRPVRGRRPPAAGRT